MNKLKEQTSNIWTRFFDIEMFREVSQLKREEVIKFASELKAARENITVKDYSREISSELNR